MIQRNQETKSAFLKSQAQRVSARA